MIKVLAEASASSPAVPLFRLYHEPTGDHFYTTSALERDNAIANVGYTDEGIAGYVFENAEAGLIPLYRLATDDHFYTTSASERDSAIAAGYKDEGIACYVIESAPPGQVPLYRAYHPHPNINEHFYTTNLGEYNNAINGGGYRAEGVQCYVFPNPGVGTIPLFRLYRQSIGDHFYTTDPAERDNAIAASGYRSEGIAGHVFGAQEPGTVPLYRLYHIPPPPVVDDPDDEQGGQSQDPPEGAVEGLRGVSIGNLSNNAQAIWLVDFSEGGTFTWWGDVVPGESLSVYLPDGHWCSLRAIDHGWVDEYNSAWGTSYDPHNVDTATTRNFVKWESNSILGADSGPVIQAYIV